MAEKSRIKKMTFTALAAAFLCVLGPVSIPIPISPVPVSLGLFAVFAAVYSLGIRYGTYAVCIYILLGLVGLPVFSGFAGGAGKLLGPTGGYLIGYIFASLAAGYFIDRSENRLIQAAGVLSGTFVCYMFGTAWLAFQAGMTFEAALFAGVIPFIPADIVKIIAVCALCPKLKRAIKTM
jgi:biotin transport system substrate-specific component